jgi:tungstate transport system substrate-binding protein
MQNYFVVAGPPGDPAGAKEAATPAEAFAAIASAGADFVSRGDRSGTHIRELSIWREIGVDPAGERWYQESAVGQAQNLLVASDKGAYTLVDDSTFLVLRDKLDLIAFIAVRDQPNVYSVMTVSPEKHVGVNADAARAFAEFLASQPALDIIAAFGQEEYGQPLFSLRDDGP